MHRIISTRRVGQGPLTPVRRLVFAMVLVAFAPLARAQWVTQSISLLDGWNGVFLHVDASHTTLNSAVGGDPSNMIQEVWRWNPPPIAQFTASPTPPSATAEWTA